MSEAAQDREYEDALLKGVSIGEIRDGDICLIEVDVEPISEIGA